MARTRILSRGSETVCRRPPPSSLHSKNQSLWFSLQQLYLQQWRYSFHAEYYTINLQTLSTSLLTRSSNVLLAHWSPVGHSIAFVVARDLYVCPNLGPQIQVTWDGHQHDFIFNGIPDWVYEGSVDSLALDSIHQRKYLAAIQLYGGRLMVVASPLLVSMILKCRSTHSPSSMRPL